ncbi:hypothetical protein L7F22_023443 [Adiantum nelumboides]|nr:hypothetical protein [Adiantum nelumboides]
MSRFGNYFSVLLRCTEVAISGFVHITYGASILSSALLADVCELISSGSIDQSATVAALEESVGADSELTSENGVEAVQASTPIVEGHDDAPIVLVHGIFGFGKGKMGKLSYWAGAEKRDSGILVPDLGPLTSIHDRARELFYFLKGGRVDYESEHSRMCGHCRYGRVYESGNYEKWDEHHPVHFVCHSTGAQVVRVLQQMLADKKFEGYEERTNADWILSLTSLSGVLNGSTRILLDGINPEDGRSLTGISLLQLLRVGVVIYEWLDIPFLKKYYGFGFDHFDMNWRTIGLCGLVKSLLCETGPFASHDWIGPDLSIHSAVECNRHLQTFPNTFYFSYATRMSRKFLGFTVPTSIMRIHPLLYMRAFQMCQWRHPTHVPLPYDGYRDEDWHDNDGALNTISMLYPAFPTPHPYCQLGPDYKDGQSLQPGLWYYTLIEGDHIFFIMNSERAGVQFDLLYTSIFQRCRKQMRRLISPPRVQEVI